MAYLDLPFNKKGNTVKVLLRNKEIEAEVVDMPFLAHLIKDRFLIIKSY